MKFFFTGRVNEVWMKDEVKALFKDMRFEYFYVVMLIKSTNYIFFFSNFCFYKFVLINYYCFREYYSNAPFSENTTVALSYGTIVVAWRRVDCSWHRARILDVSDVTGPARVYKQMSHY